MTFPVDHSDEISVAAEVHERIAELQTRLEAKEQLVSALTERLEQAAEQLDRTRRNGPGGNEDLPRGTGLPADLVEDQKSLVEQLRLVVNQWQDMQAEATLGRVEVQLNELRDLVTGRLAAQAGTVSSPSVTANSKPASLADVLSKFGFQPDAENTDAEKAKPPQARGGSSAREVQGHCVQVEHFVPSELAGPSVARPLEMSAGPQLPVPPTAIDADVAELGELRDAVIERDRYIAELTAHLHALQAVDLSEIQVPDLNDLPSAQREYLAAWEARLQKQLRNGEVELSLERARLAREQNLLRQQLDQASKDRKRDGSGLRKAAGKDADGTAEGAARTRWFGFLRGVNRNRNADEDDDEDDGD